MLQALRNLSPIDVQKALVVLSEELSARPVDAKPSYEISQEIYLSALSEARQKSGVRDDDDPITVNHKMNIFLSNEISNTVLTPNRREAVIQRLAEKKTLPLSQYKFIYSKETSKFFNELGISEDLAKDSFLNHESFFFDPGPKNPMVLYSSTLDNKFNKPCTIINIAATQGYELEYIGSWLLFAIFPPLKNAGLLDLFKIFLDQFGYNVQSMHTSWSKLIIRDTIFDNQQDNIPLISIQGNPKNIYTYCLIRNQSNYLNIFYGYSVNIELYKSYLRFYGFNI